ncbi:NAD(P)H-binding protein [Flavobacteriaceae bacterium S356]|uniref:NAD(P)H-binding protein n=1 Tax=Asprobacillus argus TaxID=3076534 RepID=A0ABU3LAS1_9FLAO|nr:NAD(P)H-binding protein [Flavobacteriaceae bacterium S356]
MKILLLGATGRTGKQVLKIAVERGYHITCLVRNPSKIKASDSVTVIKGNPNNQEDLVSALQNNSHIISVLNVSRVSDFPWAPLRTPKKYMSEVLSKLVALSNTDTIKRVAVCSAWGVSETKKDIPFWFRWLIYSSNIGAAYRDHERQEKILEESNLDWTIVRPVGLTNTTKDQIVKESFDNTPNPKLTIGRKAVASYLLDCLKMDSMIGKKVVISKS